MNTPVSTISRTLLITLATNRVLRNTYALLAMTLAFSALTAGVSMALNLPHPGLIITLVGYFGLLFAITKFRERDFSVLLVFALTGFMGYTLGPILNAYLSIPNGGQVVAMALGTTAVGAIVGIKGPLVELRGLREKRDSNPRPSG